jgi:hypothetical protein
MAAERVFYGENSNGVGGDVLSVTAQAAHMVGASAIGPQPFEVKPREDETEEEARERILERFEKIGLQIVNGRAVVARSGRTRSPPCSGIATSGRSSGG